MPLTRKERFGLLIVIVFFFLLYNLQSILNHYFFRSNALDYGFYLQVFWNYIHFRLGDLTVFHTTLKSFFQIHPSFTLTILTPICVILKPLLGTYTLVIVQNIFLALGGLFTFKVIYFKSDNFTLSILAAVHYFVLWGHFSAIAFEYIDATIAASIVPVFFYTFFKRKYLLSFTLLLFILASKENMPIWFIFIGCFLLFEQIRSKKEAYTSIAVILTSLIYLIFIFKVLIPYFHSDGFDYNRFQYSALGKNIPEAILFVFKHPVQTIELLFKNHLDDPAYNYVKTEFWLVFLISGGIILVLRPHFFLLFVPIIAQKLFSDDYQMWGINIFYSIEIVSILSIASFLIINSFKNNKTKLLISIILCITTLGTTIVKMNHRESKWYDSSKEKIYSKNFYKTNFNIPEINKVLVEIPECASVCANTKILPHLAFRDKIYYYPYLNDAEYIVFLLNSSTYPLKEDEFKVELDKLSTSKEWTVFRKTKDLLIFKRNQTEMGGLINSKNN